MAADSNNGTVAGIPSTSRDLWDDILITSVQARPILYDKGIREFKSTAKKEQAWQEISQEVGKPASKCKMRWRIIRDYYVRKKKEQKPRTPIKHYWRDSLLSFLDQYVNHRAFRTKANMINSRSPMEAYYHQSGGMYMPMGINSPEGPKHPDESPHFISPYNNDMQSASSNDSILVENLSTPEVQVTIKKESETNGISLPSPGTSDKPMYFEEEKCQNHVDGLFPRDALIDSDFLFCLSLVKDLKKVPEEKKLSVKVKLLQVLQSGTANTV